MKHRSLINLFMCAAILFSLSVYAQTGAGFTIRGSIKGINTGKITLQGLSDRVDSTVIKNGSFQLKGKLDAPEILYLKITPGNWITRVFVENTVITMQGDTIGAQRNQFTSERTLTNVRVSGSASQDQYQAYLNDPQQLKFKKQFAAIGKQLATEKDPEKIKGIKHENGDLAGQQRQWELKWINNFVTKNPSATTGVYLFADYHQFDTEMSLAGLEDMLNKFSGAAKRSVYYASLEKELNNKKALSAEHTAPGFNLLKRDGTRLNLSSGLGKYIMVDFWASWCHPCRQAIPHWKEVYQKYHDKGFEIYSISLDANREDWIKAMDIEKMPWPQVIDTFPGNNQPSVVGELYQIRYIPFYILLDPQGKILVYSGSDKDIEAKLAEVLK